jgi:hypothetical protein
MAATAYCAIRFDAFNDWRRENVPGHEMMRAEQPRGIPRRLTWISVTMPILAKPADIAQLQADGQADLGLLQLSARKRPGGNFRTRKGSR